MWPDDWRWTTSVLVRSIRRLRLLRSIGVFRVGLPHHNTRRGHIHYSSGSKARFIPEICDLLTGIVTLWDSKPANIVRSRNKAVSESLLHTFYSSKRSQDFLCIGNFTCSSHSPASLTFSHFEDVSWNMAKRKGKIENAISQLSGSCYSAKVVRLAWLTMYRTLPVFLIPEIRSQHDLIYYLRKKFRCSRQDRCTWMSWRHPNRYHHSDKVDWHIRRCLQKHQEWTYSLIVAFSEAWIVVFFSNMGKSQHLLHSSNVSKHYLLTTLTTTP